MLIPAVCAVAIWAIQRSFNRIIPFILALIGALALIGLVRVVRQFGIGNSDGQSSGFNPLAGIEEMGFSLRVLSTTVTWHEIWGEPYSYGITYLSSLIRNFESFMRIDSLNGAPDYRIMGTELSDRVGAIGGSMIAEAHHNFGPWGIILILCSFGLVIGYFSITAKGATRTAFLGVLMVLFLMHVRNSFTPIPFWAFIGLLVILILRKLPNSFWETMKLDSLSQRS